MPFDHFTIVKNAIANVVRGGASAAVALILPHFLTHSLGPDRFAGWALMLQLAAYANYLEFGVQTAVARYLAGALEVGDRERCRRLLTNALALLTLAGAVAVCLLRVLVWQMPRLFHSIPLGLSTEIGFGVMILGVSAALSLPLTAYTGVLIGMQRNEFPALAIAISRFLSVVAVVAATNFTHSLVWLALCVGGFNLFAAILQYAAVRRLLPWLQCSVHFLDRLTAKELIRYCSTLSVWSFGMLLVSGVDVTLVGLFNFEAVGAYSIAATLLMFYTGLVSAAFGAMMAPIAVLQARREYARISQLMVVATRLNSYFGMLAILVVFLFGESFVKFWVGSSYLTVTLPVLKILLIAQAVRLVGYAFGTILVGMGLQRYGLMPVLVEGISNLVLSVLGMILIGPVGVALATLIAASISLGIVICCVMPRIKEFKISSYDFIRQGVIKPVLPFVPLCLWLAGRGWYERLLPSHGAITFVPVVSMSIMTTYLVVRSMADLGWWNSSHG